MDKLSERIKVLTTAESALLKADKLPKQHRISTGLYLVCEHEHYTALDYSERQTWIEYFGSKKDAPQGWSKEFTNPLDAIDWLLSL